MDSMRMAFSLLIIFARDCEICNWRLGVYSLFIWKNESDNYEGGMFSVIAVNY